MNAPLARRPSDCLGIYSSLRLLSGQEQDHQAIVEPVSRGEHLVPVRDVGCASRHVHHRNGGLVALLHQHLQERDVGVMPIPAVASTTGADESVRIELP